MSHQMNFYENGTLGITSAEVTDSPDSYSAVSTRFPPYSRNYFNSVRQSRKEAAYRRKMMPQGQSSDELISPSNSVSRGLGNNNNNNRNGTIRTAVSSALLTAATTVSTGRAIGNRLMPALGNSHEDAAVLADLASGRGHGVIPHGGLSLTAVEGMSPVIPEGGGKKPSHDHAEHEIQLIVAISLLVLVIVIGIVGQALIVVCGACEACFSDNDPPNLSAEEESDTGGSGTSGGGGGSRYNKYSSLMPRGNEENEYNNNDATNRNNRNSNEGEMPLIISQEPSSIQEAERRYGGEGGGTSSAAAVAAAGIYLAASTAAASDVSSYSGVSRSSSPMIDFNASLSTRNDDVFEQQRDHPPPLQPPPPPSQGHRRNLMLTGGQKVPTPRGSFKRSSGVRHSSRAATKVSFIDNSFNA